MEAIEKFKIIVTEEINGQRLDKAFATVISHISRSKIQKIIDDGFVVPKKSSSYKVGIGEEFVLTVPVEDKIFKPKPQDINLDIVYEDDFLLVINKSADMVVHPGAGNSEGTLVNALMHHCKGNLSDLGGDDRPGIVHRLDKETSGLMVVAKNNDVHENLTEQLAVRNVKRIYNAVVWGLIPESGVVDIKIGRSKNDRQKMAVTYEEDGKEAITEYFRLDNFRLLASLAECRLQTGRTHQIRVHMAHIGHWLVGDPVYGRSSVSKHLSLNKINPELTKILLNFPRQALHAVSLEFTHPVNGNKMSFSSDLPEDMQNLLRALKEYSN